MRSILTLLPLFSLALAHPIGTTEKATIEKRALSDNDTSVLQLALFLEHLEFALYTGGFEAFTDGEYTAAGFPAGFRDNVGLIAQVSMPSSSIIARASFPDANATGSCKNQKKKKNMKCTN